MTVKVAHARHRMLVYVSLAAAILTGGIFATRAALSPARAVTVSQVTTQIMVNPSIGITFGPVGADAAPALSAAEAWTDYAQVNGWTATTPSNVTVQLGLVTVPVGPSSGPGTDGLIEVNGIACMAYNQLAYGYSSPVSCPPRDRLFDPNPQTATPSPTPTSCIDWSFVDANSGRQIVETWQVVG